MCRQLNDSSYSLGNSTDSYYAVKIRPIKIITTVTIQKKDSIASIKLAYIHPTKDSYKLPGNCGNYEQYTRINWTKYTSKYERIKWLKNKMCHLTDDSCCPPSKYIILLIDYKAYYTDNNRSIRIAMVLETEVFQIRDSIGTIVDRPHDSMKLSACFHAACFQVCEQAAFGVGSSAALTHKTRLTNLLYLLVNFCGNDSYHTVENIKPKDKMCHETNDSYHPLKNPLKKRIIISLNSMCYVGNDSSYTVETTPIKTTVTVQKKDSITPMSELTSIPAFHPRKQAEKPAASTALKIRSINLLYLLVNIYQTTEKNCQSFFDGRTKQKPSRRAGLVIKAIKDSPGLIRGRLEPQVTYCQAVCGGTLGWKDPPFNSILALPGATHQDQPSYEIINEIINLNLDYLISQNNSNKLNNNKNRKIKGKNIRPLPHHIDDTINISTYKLKMLLFLDMSQATPRQKLCCQIFWHKNKMCRQVNDISRHLKNYNYRISISLKNIMCHVKYDCYQVVENSLKNILNDIQQTSIYTNITNQRQRINWLGNKILAFILNVRIPRQSIDQPNWLVCRTLEGSYRLLDKYQYIPIKWQKIKVCRHLIDSLHRLENKVGI